MPEAVTVWRLRRSVLPDRRAAWSREGPASCCVWRNPTLRMTGRLNLGHSDAAATRRSPVGARAHSLAH